VVKNVTGYDMAKLLAGSFGTLAVFSSVTFKVLPRPDAERTVLVFGASPRAGVEALNRAAGSTKDITAGAHLPPEAAARSAVAYLRDAGASVTALRLEGAHDAVAERCAALRAELAAGGTCEELHTHHSRRFWAEMADGRLLAPPRGAASLLWRLTLPPAHGAATAARLTAETGGEVVFDWAGGLIWLALDAGGDAHARAVRVAAAEAGGHSVLWRADDAIRARVAVFAPEVPARAALTARIKTNFDPRGVLNPGRMFEGL
jgi:glycolate oxidase FAD binding subunit